MSAYRPHHKTLINITQFFSLVEMLTNDNFGPESKEFLASTIKRAAFCVYMHVGAITVDEMAVLKNGVLDEEDTPIANNQTEKGGES